MPYIVGLLETYQFNGHIFFCVDMKNETTAVQFSCTHNCTYFVISTNNHESKCKHVYCRFSQIVYRKCVGSTGDLWRCDRGGGLGTGDCDRGGSSMAIVKLPRLHFVRLYVLVQICFFCHLGRMSALMGFGSKACTSNCLYISTYI